MNSLLTEIAEEIERIGYNANVTTRHLDYYSGGVGRNKDAEELTKYVLQHLESIIDGLRMAAGSDSETIARDVVVAVSVLPDRSSANGPEAMLVTASELHVIVTQALTGEA